MTKRPLYTGIVAFVTVLSVVLSACAQSTPAPTTTSAPGATTSTPPRTSTAPTTTTVAPTTTAAAAAKPQYGGTLTYPLTADITNWDSGLNGSGGALVDTVYQQYMSADWRKGPAGDNSVNWAGGATSTDDSSMPMLMESWTMPSIGVWVMNIRKGVYWQNPGTDAAKLVGGRQVTVDDIISSFKYLQTSPRSWLNVAQAPIAQATTIEKTGDWQVTIKTPVDYLTSWTWFIQGAGSARLYPPEVIAKYGNMGDWHNAIGTGPFFLTDYVKGSSLTFSKNPNYWETDPVGPGKGNKLPYLDTLKQVIITDLSSRIAAFRTGKVDLMDGTAQLNSIDAQPLFKEKPQIQSVKYLSTLPWAITMRTDKSDQPFSKLQVRQALMMGTDFNALSQTLFAGDAEIDVWPVSKFFPKMYTPLAQMPQEVQDLYVYNPTKAKQYLANAGYPNGFETSVVVSSVDQTKVDDLTAFQAQWAKIGVKLKLDIRDNAVYTAMNQARSNDQMSYRFVYGTFSQQMYYSPERGSSTNNPSYINEPPGANPDIEALFQKTNSQLFVDWPGAFKTYQGLKPVLLAQAYMIVRPTPYTYNVYWPYVQNYFGQSTVSFVRYIWIDQAAKAKLFP